MQASKRPSLSWVNGRADRAVLTQYVVEHFAHDAGSDVDQGSVSTYLLPLVALVVGQLPGEAGVEFFRDAGWQRLATGEVFADARWQCLRLAIAVVVTTENLSDVVEVIVVAALEIVIIVIVVVAMGGFFSLMPLLNIGCCATGTCSVPATKKKGK